MGPCSRPMSPGQLELWIIFFFPPEALSCPRHRGHRTSEAERTRWARLPGRCGPVSWSFGSFFFFFFFFLQKPSLVPVTGGTLHLRARGRDGSGFQADVAGPAGASGFFFFLQKPSLVPVTGGAVLLRPRGRDGPVFQADVARSAGALDHFFFPSRSPLLSPSPGAPYI